MGERRLFRHQALAHHLEFAHELREQIPGLGELLGFPECLKLDTELAHSPCPQVAAGASQLMGHSCQRPPITLLERVPYDSQLTGNVI